MSEANNSVDKKIRYDKSKKEAKHTHWWHDPVMVSLLSALLVTIVTSTTTFLNYISKKNEIELSKKIYENKFVSELFNKLKSKNIVCFRQVCMNF